MTRKLFGVLAALALVSGAMVALIGPASAAQDGSEQPMLTITVHKAVTGTPASDQHYQVRVQCVHEGEQVFAQTQDIVWNSVDGTFTPSDANAIFEIPTRVGGESTDITCTVLEVGTAGAASHTIECTDDSGDATCTDPDTVTIPYIGDGTADLTVTNVYPAPAPTPTPTPAPAPAPVVAAAARFTG